MPKDLTVKLHEIAVDGLPPRGKYGAPDDDYTLRIGFLFDGCIVSGWPLYKEDFPELYTVGAVTRRAQNSCGGAELNAAQRYEMSEMTLWEADTDVGHNKHFSSVTHWVEFPEGLHIMEKLKQ